MPTQLNQTSSPTADEYRAWLGVDQDAANAEIRTACHRKFCKRVPSGNGTGQAEKEEAMQQVRSAFLALTDGSDHITEIATQQNLFGNGDQGMKNAIVPFTFRYPPVIDRNYDRPINAGQSTNAGIQLRPVYAHWLRGGKGAFLSHRVVRATDPRPDRFEDPNTAYSHSGGPYHLKRKADSELSRETSLEDDRAWDEERSTSNSGKPYRNSRGLLRAAPRGRKRER